MVGRPAADGGDRQLKERACGMCGICGAVWTDPNRMLAAESLEGDE